jgi:glycosyltransferase involved in cell wall biosynthesis
MRTVSSKSECFIFVSSTNPSHLVALLASFSNLSHAPHHLTILGAPALELAENYVVRQLLHLIQIEGTSYSIVVTPSNGIHAARDLALDKAQSDFAWFLDEDVIVTPKALLHLEVALTLKDFVYVTGAKVDIRNYRGYVDHSTDYKQLPEVGNLAETHFRYLARHDCLIPTVKIDTGNLWLNVKHSREVGFNPLKIYHPVSGEDTIFAMRVRQLFNKRFIFSAYYAPRSLVFHTDKPSDKRNWTPANLTKALTKAQADLLNILPEHYDAVYDK